ncbi:hypothetical protein ACFPAF_08290 [Hymenobacter endophyticus]|uniref:Uncharacterized protein n=1 Tax=Hymenobacter endophyticus TaxID=3076335 RepID=A0ABU3TG96_9BACT|nr:hypothetical protein [Hymenobacter endophyticus]MDU0370384.1 hypothetical protein [Hymenobacter endophyticus]
MFRIFVCWALFFAGVLGAAPGHAQNKPAPPPRQKVLNVRVVLPTMLGKLAEVAGLLPDSGQDKAQTSTDNPVVTLAVPLPRFLSKSEPAPAKPRKP